MALTTQEPPSADAVEEALLNVQRLLVVDRIVRKQWPVPEVQEMLVDLAAYVDAPFAAATMLDGTTQHFLATNGGPMETCSRDTSHCQYVITTGTFLAIHDAATEVPWKQRARNIILGKRLQAYLGVPLKVDGQVIGAVCVVDTEAHEWTPDEQFETYRVARKVSEILERLAH